MLSSVCRNQGVNAEPVLVNHGEVCWASGCESCWGMQSQWFVNHGVLCCTNGRESWRVILCQWLRIMLCYTESFVGNHDVKAVPVGVNHVMLFWVIRWESRCELSASRYESWWVMLGHWLWITVCYAEPVLVNNCVMLSRMCGNHDVLCWASGWESWCERCASGSESCCAILSQSLGITMWTQCQ